MVVQHYCGNLLLTERLNKINYKGGLADNGRKESDVRYPPLYYKYAGQLQPQDAYIEMDEGGGISAEWNGEIGNAVPAGVWHHRSLRWSITPEVSQEMLDELLADGSELRRLLAVVHEGHSVDWNDSNHVGVLNDDAQAARHDVDNLLHRLGEEDCLPVWEAADWLGGCTVWRDGCVIVCMDEITSATTDAALELLAAEYEGEAEHEGVCVDGILEHLTELREGLELRSGAEQE